MRDSFSKSLVEYVKQNSNAYVLSGDHGYALFDALRTELPSHFINAGVAEQNMIGVGAGLSKLGLFPIMYGLSAFVPIRVLEQIKIDFCYENLPGLFIGDGAGVVYSHLGASHQSTEDIAALRGLPNISILSPCDAFEFKACFGWAIEQQTPVYMRMGKADLGAVHASDLKSFSIQPLKVMNSESKQAIFATGSMVKPCMDLIKRNHLNFDLFSVPVLKACKRIEFDLILKKYEKVFTVEEHSINGGLGDILASAAAKLGGVRVKKIGIVDKFSEHCGSYQYLMQEHGLDLDGIERQLHFE